MKSIEFFPIGFVSTCFKEKFGIPRQPGLVVEARGVLKLKSNPFLRNAVRELESFSHIWILFVFHKNDSKNWKPSIRPPRLGGAKKVGVLASRSPHRPNPIGMSAVQLDRIDFEAPGGVELYVSGVDFLDGTPVLDIKPYISYADSIPNSISGWARDPIEKIPVDFTEVARSSLQELEEKTYPFLEKLIVGMLELDPRPAFQKRHMPSSSLLSNGSLYGLRLFDFDVKWKIHNGRFCVLDIVPFL